MHRDEVSQCVGCMHRVVQVCDRIMPGYGEQMRAISLR